MSDGDRRAERGAGRRPEHVRIGERVAEQALERRAGDRQADPDDHRGQDARQPQVPDDRLGRRRPGPPEVEPEQPMGEDRERVERRDGDAPERRRRGTSATTRATSPPSREQHRPADGRARSSPTVGRAASAPIGVASRVRHRRSRTVRATGGIGGRRDGRIRMDRRGQRAQAVDQPRTGPGDDEVVDRPDVARP